MLRPGSEGWVTNEGWAPGKKPGSNTGSSLSVPEMDRAGWLKEKSARIIAGT